MVLSIILKKLKSSFTDLLPIIAVITFFQILVLRQPLPQMAEVLLGGLLVVVGLTLFIQGLEMGLFPIGEAMAHALARKGSLFWLLFFAFALGFSTTVAEPALIAVASEAAKIASQGGLIDPGPDSMNRYAFGLRMSVAFSRLYASYRNVDSRACSQMSSKPVWQRSKFSRTRRSNGA